MQGEPSEPASLSWFPPTLVPTYPALQGEPSEPASSSDAFYRDWRRNCPSADAKYR